MFELFQILSSYRMSISQTGCNVNLPLLCSTLQAWSRQTGGGSQQKQTAQLQSQAQPLTLMTLLKQVSLVLFVVSANKGHDNQRIVSTEKVQSLESASPREAS